MPAPKRIKAAGTTYRIEYVDTIPSPDGDGELAGDCYGPDQRIRVSLAQGEEKQRSALLHEVVHAVVDELNYDWPEALVLQAERAFWLIIRDNPGLLRYIRERSKKE